MQELHGRTERAWACVLVLVRRGMLLRGDPRTSPCSLANVVMTLWCWSTQIYGAPKKRRSKCQPTCSGHALGRWDTVVNARQRRRGSSARRVWHARRPAGRSVDSPFLWLQRVDRGARIPQALPRLPVSRRISAPLCMYLGSCYGRVCDREEEKRAKHRQTHAILLPLRAWTPALGPPEFLFSPLSSRFRYIRASRIALRFTAP